jgi:hypothetical protein
VDVSNEDWFNWAITHDIAPEVIAFHRFTQGEYLHKFDPAKKVKPLPRTWEFLSSLTKVNPDKDIEFDLYAGCVGEEAAGQFVGFLRIFRDLPDIDECLSSPTKASVPTDIGAVFCVISALARAVTRPTLKNFITYVKRLGSEYEHLSITDAMKINPALKESKEYLGWFQDNLSVFGGK